MYDRILVPTDGSDGAEHAAHHALSLARRFDAALSVLAVADVAGAAGPFDAGGAEAATETGLLDCLADRAQDAAETVADRARGASVTPAIPASS